LWDQLDALAKHLVPAYDQLREYVLGADVVGADETWWRLMDKKMSTKRWWAWSMTSADSVWHGIAPSRSAETAKKFLAGYEGTLMVDGYKAYDALAKERPAVRLAHCWAHVRRHFVEAEANHPTCTEAIDLIGQLFQVDRGTRDPSLLEGDAKFEAERERLERRRTEARPILDRLRTWASQQRGLPKSGLRKAIDYMLQYWQGLTVFLEDPYVPLDNNRTERALRGLVLGRKNHYGSRSQRGTEVAAIFYSLIDSATMLGINPADYIYSAAINQLEFGRTILPAEFAALPPGA
jgi:transposase